MERPQVLQQEDNTVRKRLLSPLMVRIYSALIMAAFALFLTLNSVESFTGLIAIAVVAMGWEWGHLVRGKGLDAAFLLQAIAAVAACIAVMLGFPGWSLMVVLAGTASVFFVRCAADGGGLEARWSATGVSYAGLPAIALIWFRGDDAYGTLAVIYLFAVVWTTDIAAYFFGRLIGGPKLARFISPKKTWAGLIGGVLSAALAGAVFAYAAGFYALWLGIMALGFALIAQLGDLGESAVKRIFGKKDSSHLIPGHGGILDRVDGLVSVAVLAALLVWIIDPAHPGRALLVW